MGRGGNGVLVFLGFWFALACARAQTFDPLLAIRPKDRAAAIDEGRRVTLAGPLPPAAGIDRGAVPSSFSMERMVLVLRPGADQQSALTQLNAALQDGRSAYYHRWLTPQTFGAHFGVSERDLDAVIAWLRSYGFAVGAPPASCLWLVFSGTAAQVESAFHTPIHTYLVNGRLHYANSSAPDIPEGLAEVVEGPMSLSDFHASPSRHRLSPQYLSNGSDLIAPYDFAAIYGSIPLYSNGSSLEGGLGVNIAIVGRSNINPSDITDLADNSSNFGIALPQVMTPYGDPGVDCVQSDPDYGLTGCGDWLETTLDVTRAGSVAPQAGVILVPAASTHTTDGLVLSAQYIVDHNVAQVVSLSYSVCEPVMTSSVVSLWTNLWNQAAAQGMSVFVAAGDWGADACLPQREAGSTSFKAPAVNGLCSSPSVVCVGGTQFDDTANPGSYWSGAGNALGYIPENVWNETESSSTFASGGGASILYTKPSWQQALTPADGARDVPDVSLSAAYHDAYLLYIGGAQTSVEGTSAAAPSFAGIMALMISATGSDTAWGNPAPVLYELQQEGLTNPFHPTTAGNNSVPGVTGFSVTQGPYNQATGLGSVDAAVLAGEWPVTTLAINVTHQGNFSEEQQGATYTVNVSTTTRPTSGAIVVNDSLPSGLTMVNMTGTGWNCSTTTTNGTCARSDSLNPQSSYPIQVTVNVGSGAASPVTNTVSVAGGGALTVTAQDVTTILLLGQAISFAPITTQILEQLPFTLTATASSGLAVAFSAAPSNVCQVSGSTVTLEGPGTCTITASQAGNATYSVAKSVEQSFLVVTLCDLTMAGGTSLGDVRQIVNQALGIAPPQNNLTGDAAVGAADIQIEINAALGLGCGAK
ncbi:MAG TPA: protease pro-enzyme activation domain-containing protein [Bryobacteraceae bacterium]|nr:protease pro-enzyme activation domain-containing protein [Bryobacteraceae bacterium]